MPVYLIQAGVDGPVKIGHARNPLKRMAGFQCGNAQTLRLVRIWSGGQPEEAVLHRAFSDFHIQGEWFRFCQTMLDADPAGLLETARMAKDAFVMSLKNICPKNLHQKRIATALDVDTIIEEAGGILAVAEKVGVDRATVYDWKRNKVLPASRIAQIHSALGVDLAVLIGLTKPPAPRRAA